MHDSKNRIGHRDRIILIKVVKSMVYSKSEIELNTIHSQLKSHEVAKKYPQFLQHINSLWPRRKEWAVCFRQDILIRGNNTNNYAEAGIRIIKDQVFSRIKTYNLIQMFSFITESMEVYYQRKLLNVSNNRLDNVVAEKFLGKGASTVQQGLIESLGNGMYKVQSRHRLQGGEEKYHVVDMHIGACKGKRWITMCTPICCSSQVQNTVCQLLPISEYTLQGKQLQSLLLETRQRLKLIFMHQFIRRSMSKMLKTLGRVTRLVQIVK